jgi:hypothetical protein
MNRKFKAIGAAVIAALAAIAMSTSAPAAEFHSESAHTIFKGWQLGEAVLTVNAGTLTCKEISTEYTGEATTTTFQLSGTTAFKECTAFGFVNATADLNGCEIKANADTNTVDVVGCVSPAAFTAFNCWVTIENQTGLSSTNYTNIGTGKGRYLIGHANLSGITYTQHSKFFPGCTGGTFSNGTLVGEGALKGFDTEGKEVGIWKE